MRRLLLVALGALGIGCGLTLTRQTAAQEKPNPVTHIFMVLSTNFEVEPVLDTYLATYPDGLIQRYEVIFKEQNVRPGIPYSYIILLPEPNFKSQNIDFWEYVDAWTKLHRGKWMMAEQRYWNFPDLNTQKRFSGQLPISTVTPKP